MLLSLSQDCFGIVALFLETCELNSVMRTCKTMRRRITFRMAIDCRKSTEAKYKHAIIGTAFIRIYSAQGRRAYDLYAVPHEINSKYFIDQQYIVKAPGDELMRGKVINIAFDGDISRMRDFDSSGNGSLFESTNIKVDYIYDRIQDNRRTVSTRIHASFDRSDGLQGADVFDLLIMTRQCVSYVPFHVIDRCRLKRKSHPKACIPEFMR